MKRGERVKKGAGEGGVAKIRLRSPARSAGLTRRCKRSLGYQKDKSKTTPGNRPASGEAGEVSGGSAKGSDRAGEG